MIDIHCHVLNGIDDGAVDLQESQKMIELMIEDGITTAIATSHFRANIYDYSVQKYEETYTMLCKYIQKNKLDFQVLLGHEAYLDEELIGSLRNGNCMTLADSSYVLVELDQYAPMGMSKKILYNLMLEGYRPIIAHSERILTIKKDTQKVMDLKNMGCLLQVNSNALLKPRKRWIRRWILQGIQNGAIFCVASDGHHVDYRRPVLKKAYQFVENKLSKAYADKVFNDNQQIIINSHR